MRKEEYNFQDLRQELIKETKQKISKSITKDNFISQAISAISELDRVANILAKRLREWYELYNPEISHEIESHEHFCDKVLETNNQNSEMGGHFEEKDLNQVKSLAQKLRTIYDEKESLTIYLKDIMSEYCPNVLEITGVLIGAKLLGHKGTLRELAFMPSSTIQILGAEKALFRHLKFNAKSPKFGYIMQHVEIGKASNKGKAARQLANKISIAAKKDYFSKEENK